MWTCTPTNSARDGCRRSSTSSARASLDRHAELVALQPGRDVRMALGVDVGVDAQRDPRRPALARARSPSMRSSSPADSALIALRPSGTARSSSSRRLADAGEDDLGRREAGAQRDARFRRHRVGVGAAAEAAQQPHERQRRVRLERVVHRVRIAGEGRRRARGTGADQRRRCRRTPACRRASAIAVEADAVAAPGRRCGPVGPGESDVTGQLHANCSDASAVRAIIAAASSAMHLRSAAAP